MTLGLVFKFLHVLTSFWFVSGVIGRGITFRQAKRAANISSAAALLHASTLFDTLMVRSGGSLILLFGLLTAWLQHWPLFGFLQGARTNWLLLSLLIYIAMIPPIPLVLLPRARQREKILENALSVGEITPELTAAMNDPAVARIRNFELAGILIIIALMVLKPF